MQLLMNLGVTAGFRGSVLRNACRLIRQLIVWYSNRLGGIAVSRFLGKEEVAGSIPARGLIWTSFLFLKSLIR